jgi:hypothetical protein
MDWLMPKESDRPVGIFKTKLRRRQGRCGVKAFYAARLRRGLTILLVLASSIVSQGCAESKLGAAGAQFDDELRGEPAGAVYFFKRSRLDDDAFARIYPSLVDYKVTRLTLQEVPITDASMRLIRQIPTLKTLWLDKTKVSVSGVLLLLDAPRITQIEITSSDFTAEEVRLLIKKMPGVVNVHPPHID